MRKRIPRHLRTPRPEIDPTARRYYIYRLLDARGECLYIGRSCNPLSRLKEHHATGAEWPKRVVQIDAHGGRYTWDEAVKLEREAILRERPPFNVDGVKKNTGRRPRIEVAA